MIRSFDSTGHNNDQFYAVSGVCIDDERKRILIADYWNHRLSVWSHDGSQFIKPIPIPNNLYNGVLIATDFDNHRVQMF